MTEIYRRCFSVDKKTEEKTFLNPKLSKSELEFIYELNSPIESFGYSKDPRIKELRKLRNIQEDLPILFNCTPEQIATKPEDLKPDTVAYVGKWTPEVLKIIPENIKYIYESFPDKKVFLKTIETNPNIKSPADAEREILAKGIKFYGGAQEILQKTPFSKEGKEYGLVSFSVENLGFPRGATTKEIYAKAKELGLETCPAEVGPLLRLNYLDQPNGEYLWIAMDAIVASDGSQHLFKVDRVDGGLRLDTRWDNPDGRWDPNYRLVFLRRKD